MYIAKIDTQLITSITKKNKNKKKKKNNNVNNCNKYGALNDSVINGRFEFYLNS
jgi:hypothetical protein